MNVRIINADNYVDLEKKVNQHLEDAKRWGYKVLDIKFSGAGSRAPYGTNYWSAMIIME